MRPRRNSTVRPSVLNWIGALMLAAGFASPAGAIISDRYLTGVHAFECDGEWDDAKDAQTFKLVMSARDARIRLIYAGAQESMSTYQIVENAISFAAHLPSADNAQCLLYLPAGSLSCRRGDSAHPGQFIGLCLPEP
jgi:hypothetical protein